MTKAWTDASRNTGHGRRSALALATLIALFAGAISVVAKPSTAPASGGAATFVDYAQCANGAPSPEPSSGCPSGWINGILNANNSHYAEDQVTPQRAQVTVPKGSAATGRTLTFRYQTRKGTIHAYDSLATWNLTQKGADRCQGLAANACVGGAPSEFAIPDDATAVPPVGTGVSPVTTNHMIPTGADRVMTMYGGTITGISTPVHDNPAGPGDDYATIVVTYKVVDTRAARPVQLLFGGHLAAGQGPRGWGENLGSSSIPGGPYHIKLAAADGVAIGNRDNQIQAAAILPLAGLTVTKTADDDTVDSGDQVGFGITVTNTGGATATNVTLSDPLPTGPGLDWSESPDSAACAISGTAATQQTLTCSFGALAPNASVTVHVVSATTTSTPGTLVNTATAQADGVPPVTGTDSVTVNSPSLAVDKVADDATVSAGDPIGFTVTVSNGGAGTAKNVTLTDSLPGGAGVDWSIGPGDYRGPGTCGINGEPPNEILVCAFGDLAPNASAAVHVLSQTTEATSGAFENTAVAEADNNPPTDDTTTTTVDAPLLVVDKTADDVAVSSGSPIGFTIEVGNEGSGTATSVTLADPLPLGTGLDWSITPAYTGPGTCAITGDAPNQQTLACSFGDFSPGDTATVHISSSTAAGTSGTFENVATADATNSPETTGTDSTTVNRPNLTMSKTADDESVDAGSPIGFTMTVTNEGPGTATGVTLSDLLPIGTGLDWSEAPENSACSVTDTAPPAGEQTLNCTFGDLAPNGSVSVHVVSPTSEDTTGTFDNTATAQSTNNPPVTGTDSTTVNQPSLSVVKQAANDVVDAGESIGFTMTVSNGGPGTATNVTLDDPLPMGAGLNWSESEEACSITGAAPDQQTLSCVFGDLAPNASASVTVSSPTTAETSGVFENTATADADNAPETTGTDSVTVNQPELGVEKTADSATVDPGDPIGFTVTVTNGGPGAAHNVAVTDLLPGGDGVNWSIDDTSPEDADCSIAGSAPSQTLSCAFGTLAPNTSASVHVVSQTTGASCGIYPNSATVTAANSVAVTPAAASTEVRCVAVLEVSKIACAGTAVPGGTLLYTISYANNGTAPAEEAVLVDTIPAGTAVADPGGGTVSDDGTTVTWALGTLAVDQNGTTTFSVSVPASADGTTLVNSVALSSAGATTATSTEQTPVSSEGAAASGRAFGLSASLLGGTLGVPPTPDTDVDNPDTLLTLDVPPLGSPIVHAEVLSVVDSPSVSPTEAKDTAIATAAQVNIEVSGVTVSADSVVASSESHATGLTAGSSRAGSRVQNLVVNGTTYGDVTDTKTIEVKNPLTGNPIAEVHVLEQVPSGAAAGVVQPNEGFFTSGLTVNGIRIDVLASTVEVVVSHAESMATFPSAVACGQQIPQVRGEAFIVDTPKLEPPVGRAQVGLVRLPITGGEVDSSMVDLAPLGVGVGTTHTKGSLSPLAASSRAVVNTLDLLGGLITATTVEATSATDSAGSTGGTVIEDLQIGDIDVCSSLVDLSGICRPAPNTVLVLNEGNMIVVLNEQVPGTGELRVNAVHIYVVGKDNPLNLPVAAEVVISSAFSGTTP